MAIMSFTSYYMHFIVSFLLSTNKILFFFFSLLSFCFIIVFEKYVIFIVLSIVLKNVTLCKR